MNKVNFSTTLFEANDGSFHRSKKLAKKHNKLIKALNENKKIWITVREGCQTLIFDDEAAAKNYAEKAWNGEGKTPWKVDYIKDVKLKDLLYLTNGTKAINNEKEVI